jgi:hypothetical protein
MTHLSASTNSDDHPLSRQLNKINACRASMEWVQSFDSFDSAYNACHDARWIIWLAIITSYDTHKVTAALDAMKIVWNDEWSLDLSIQASQIHVALTRRYASFGTSYFNEVYMIPKDIDDKCGLSSVAKRYDTCEALKTAFYAKCRAI